MQLCLLDTDPPGIDPRFNGIQRREIGDGAWIEHLPGWLAGHGEVMSHLVETTRWRADQRMMYERVVAVPRLLARVPDDGPGHPVIRSMQAALTLRYGMSLSCISLAYYRNGQDSVAMHGDRLGRIANNMIVAIVSVGTPRRFRLQPEKGGTSLGFDLGWGDLLVMGGTCQRTWRHGVPKVRHGEPRISIQFRPNLEPHSDGD